MSEDDLNKLRNINRRDIETTEYATDINNLKREIHRLKLIIKNRFDYSKFLALSSEERESNLNDINDGLGVSDQLTMSQYIDMLREGLGTPSIWEIRLRIAEKKLERLENKN